MDPQSLLIKSTRFILWQPHFIVIPLKDGTKKTLLFSAEGKKKQMKQIFLFSDLTRFPEL